MSLSEQIRCFLNLTFQKRSLIDGEFICLHKLLCLLCAIHRSISQRAAGVQPFIPLFEPVNPSNPQCKLCVSVCVAVHTCCCMRVRRKRCVLTRCKQAASRPRQVGLITVCLSQFPSVSSRPVIHDVFQEAVGGGGGGGALPGPPRRNLYGYLGT